MKRTVAISAVPVVLITVAALGLWWGTDHHFYTKFEVVKQVEVEVDPEDPLAQAGFYDGETVEKTVRRDEFHLGLLPTPRGLFDKHVISVVSIVFPAWLLGGATLICLRRRTNRQLHVSASPTSANVGGQ